MRAFTRRVYRVLGALAIVAGIAAFVKPSLVLGADATTNLTEHLIREEASAFVFIGLMFLWCARHFDQRRPVHVALIVFSVLWAGAHWVEYARDLRRIGSPLVNSGPFAILAITLPRGSRLPERPA